MKNLIIGIILISLSAYKPVEPSKIIFRINGLKTTEGTIYISIFNREDTFMDKPVASHKKSNFKGNETEIIFENVAPGNYAASVYHDVNDNGELDSNWMGIPKEPYGFSNNARGSFGPASYEDCKFEVKSGEIIHTITLK